MNDLFEELIRMTADTTAHNTAPWFLNWVIGDRCELVIKTGDVLVARFHRRVRITLLVVSIFFSLMTVGFGFFFHSASGAVLAVPFLVCTLGCWFFYFDVTVRQIEFDRRQLTVTTRWKGPRHFEWSDAAVVDYSEWLGGYTLHLQDGQRVYISDIMDGSAMVVRLARAAVRRNKAGKAQ